MMENVTTRLKIKSSMADTIKLSFYENQMKLKKDHKINSFVSNLSSALNEINEESNIKLSEIRQNFFISKLKWLERYNYEWEDQLNQIISKTPVNYDVDESVKSKLDRVEKERVEIQNEIFKRRIKKLTDYFDEFETVYNELKTKMKSNHLKPKDINSFVQITLLRQKFELILKNSTIDNLNENILHDAKQQLLDPLNELAERTKIEIEQFLKNRDETQTKIKDEKRSENESIKSKSEKQEKYDGYASKSDLDLYIQMRKYKIELEESIKEFSTDDRYKTYRLNLSLYIKTTVNSLSSNSQDHIRDKIDRYTRLFSGQNVEYRDKFLSINDHKDAFKFCIYHTANSFLVTGLKQVLSSTKSAVSFAQVMVYLWIRFEEFGKILLAFFFEMCPYTVPFYPPRDPDDDELTYLITCGYSLKKDGSLEEEDVFLNKMRGSTKLFASILQIQVSTNPLNLAIGWKWLASILNLEPRSSVSPAVIHAFISTVDTKLRSTYGKQFIKLLKYIKSIYLPKLDALNLKNLQAKVQLETYIDEQLKFF